MVIKTVEVTNWRDLKCFHNSLNWYHFKISLWINSSLANIDSCVNKIKFSPRTTVKRLVKY